MSRKLQQDVAIIVGAAILAIVAAAPSAIPQTPHDGRPASPALRDLRSLDELRETFNHDQGKIRLLLLLSPT